MLTTILGRKGGLNQGLSEKLWIQHQCRIKSELIILIIIQDEILQVQKCLTNITYFSD